MPRYFIIPVLLLVLVCAAPGAAFAFACTSPTGNEGDQIYSSNYHVMQFCNGTSWVNMGAGGAAGTNGTSGALTLISTQTASSSATLQWTGLPNYGSYYLECNNIVFSAVADWNIRVGEGSTPTWETASYNYVLNVSNQTAEAVTYSTTGAAIFLNYPNTNHHVAANSSYGASLHAWIGSVTGGDYVAVNFLSSTFNNGETSLDATWGEGQYIGDTNAITAIETLPTTGNFVSGSCSLYGLNH